MNEIVLTYVGPSSIKFKHVGPEEFFCKKNTGALHTI